MSTIGTRGKTAEALVKKKLASLESARQAHARWPDARAGSFAVALADFLIMRDRRMTLLEVKEVAHDFRMSHTNLGLDQIARMRMWSSAGAQADVLVYHSTTKLWRTAEIHWFHENYRKVDEKGKAVGSWDLRSLEHVTLDEYFGGWL